METKRQENKWFRTGFICGGVASVDAGSHTLKDAVVIRPGEAKGHGVWIDQEFCASVVTMAAQGKSATSGLKARFGHPNMCSEALGTFLGRWKNLRLREDGAGIGDLHLSSTATESPKGDLRKYVEEMAAKEPDHFGASIVFSMDYEAMTDFAVQNGAKIEYGQWGFDGFIKQGECASCKDVPEGSQMRINWESFKSPDPANVQNLPHARCAELHAADLVDDPAATDGMFSGAAGLSIAGQMTEFLDTHPEIFKALTEDPGMLDIVTRYSADLDPFLKRYAENRAKLGTTIQTVTTVWTDVENTPDGSAESESSTEEDKPAESEDLSSKVNALTAQVSEQGNEITSLRQQLLAATQRAETAEAQNKTLTTERDELSVKVKTVLADNVALTASRDELTLKVKAFENGTTPVSAVPVSETKKTGGSLMERARAKKG